MTHATSPQTPMPSAPHAAAVHAVDCERRLRLVLRTNAATSTVTGVIMAAAPQNIDELLGTNHSTWIRLIGLALLIFAAGVAWLSTTEPRVLQSYTPAIIAGDVGWVVASVVTVLLGWYSGRGVAAVLITALVIDTFALLQFGAVRRLRRG